MQLSSAVVVTVMYCRGHCRLTVVVTVMCCRGHCHGTVVRTVMGLSCTVVHCLTLYDSRTLDRMSSTVGHCRTVVYCRAVGTVGTVGHWVGGAGALSGALSGAI